MEHESQLQMGLRKVLQDSQAKDVRGVSNFRFPYPPPFCPSCYLTSHRRSRDLDRAVPCHKSSYDFSGTNSLEAS